MSLRYSLSLSGAPPTPMVTPEWCCAWRLSTWQPRVAVVEKPNSPLHTDKIPGMSISREHPSPEPRKGPTNGNRGMNHNQTEPQSAPLEEWPAFSTQDFGSIDQSIRGDDSGAAVSADGFAKLGMKRSWHLPETQPSQQTCGWGGGGRTSRPLPANARGKKTSDLHVPALVRSNPQPEPTRNMRNDRADMHLGLLW